MSGVTQKQLAEALQRARQLSEHAYGKHEVKQRDGSVLELCLKARLDRAYRLWTEAEGDMAAKIQQAYTTLAQQVHDACDAAEKAASEYMALAVSAGVTPTEIPRPTCDCEGCQRSALLKEFVDAEAELRHEAYRLLTPNDIDGRLPALVETLELGEEKLRKRLNVFAAAMKRYAVAHQALDGTVPDWTNAYGL